MIRPSKFSYSTINTRDSCQNVNFLAQILIFHRDNFTKCGGVI